MNADLLKRALVKIPNPGLLVNLLSQRVRQLNRRGGGQDRPLVSSVEHLSAADIALREIVESKMSFEPAEVLPLTRPTSKNRARPQHWAKL